MTAIHPTAVVDPKARLASDVRVGAYTVIDAGVEVGEGTEIGPHVVLQGPMTIGRHNRIFQFASLGAVSQDKTAKTDEPTRVEIGDGNTIREYVTINRGTLKEQGVTRVGNDNWIMAYCHIAHDCTVGDHTILANGTTFAGHVKVEEYAVLGGGTLVHQFVTLGAHCFSAGGAAITRDVPPFLVVQDNPAIPRGINLEGLKRRGFTPEDIADIKAAYRALFIADQKLDQAKREMAEIATRSPHVKRMLEFVEGAKRLIQK
jgi:UDP-N-acetylglucosamine acyltransferase